MDDQSLKDILKLAHKSTSPRSVTDTSSASISSEERYVADINRYAHQFLKNILSTALMTMSHFMRLTVHPFDISYALEFFVKLQNVNQLQEAIVEDTEGSSDESAWNMSDEDDENMLEDDSDSDDKSENEDSDDEREHEDSEDDEERLTMRWQCDDSDEDSENDEESIFITTHLNEVSTPLFDESFEPLDTPVTFSRHLFWSIQDLVQSDYRFCPVWEDGAMEKLAHALYAFLVAKLK
jgi:hypothetical protein